MTWLFRMALAQVLRFPSLGRMPLVKGMRLRACSVIVTPPYGSEVKLGVLGSNTRVNYLEEAKAAPFTFLSLGLDFPFRIGVGWTGGAWEDFSCA